MVELHNFKHNIQLVKLTFVLFFSVVHIPSDEILNILN